MESLEALPGWAHLSVSFHLYLSVIELTRFLRGGEGPRFVPVTPIQIISNQWDYPSLRRNQTHSLSRRLELPASALTALRVPAFATQTRERGRQQSAHGRTQRFLFFFPSMHVTPCLIYEEDTLGRGHKRACAHTHTHKRTKKHNAVCPLRDRQGLLPTQAVTPLLSRYGMTVVPTLDTKEQM